MMAPTAVSAPIAVTLATLDKRDVVLSCLDILFSLMVVVEVSLLASCSGGVAGYFLAPLRATVASIALWSMSSNMRP